MKMTSTAHSPPENILSSVDWISSIKHCRNEHYFVVFVFYVLTSTHSEVDLCLESEDGEAKSDPGGDPYGYEDGFHLVVGGDGAKHDALAHREDSQENEVCGERSADGLAAGHGQQAGHHHSQAGEVDPAVLLDKKPHLRNKEEGGDDGAREDKLRH